MTNLVTPRYIEVLCPNVSTAFFVTVGSTTSALLSDELSPPPPLGASSVRDGWLDCDPVLMESDRVCDELGRLVLPSLFS